MKGLIDLRNLKTYYFTRAGVVKACDDVTFSLDKGESFGLVKETGSGKSTIGLSILRLITFPGRIVSGNIFLQGEDLLKKSENFMRQEIRGKKIAVIWQDPTASLDPVYKVKDQLIEAIDAHQNVSKEKANDMTIDLLRTMGIPSASKQIESYPHELSGGMKQRVMIAMALSCQPILLIADEPTSNLDVTISAQILELIREIQEKTGTAMLLITHNLGIVAEYCSRVGVMYCGSLVETGGVVDLFKSPEHPYTKGLINSIPKPTSSKKELMAIPGSAASPLNPPSGCKFHPRCSYCKRICEEKIPDLKALKKGHYVACHLAEEGKI